MNCKKKLPKIIGGFLNVTQRCNLKCKYCFVYQQPKEMTYQVAQDATNFYAKNAEGTKRNPSINFFGGEPLLRWNDIVVPLTKYIRKKYGKKYGIGITTNGTLLTEEKLKFMKGNGMGLLFSIDGNKKTQDLNRPFHNGEGSFDTIKDKIPYILKYYPNTTFRSTIDHDNVYEIANNYKFAIEQGYNNMFMIVNVFSKWTKEERKELKNQIKQVANIYMQLLKQNKIVSFNQFDDAFKKIKQINQAEENNQFRNQNERHPGFGRCGIGATSFASVGPTGNLYSCQELTENPKLGDKFKIGNIYEGVNEQRRWDIINKFDPRNVIRSDGKPCIDCLMNKICNGNCLINNYLAYGDMNIMPSILCDYYQVVLNESIRIINVMAEEKNKKFKRIFQRA